MERHHYSRSYVAARRRFGLYRGGQLQGVAVFSQPVQEKALQALGPAALGMVTARELYTAILDAERAVEQAFGFDLTPLVARAAEFDRLAQEVRGEAKARSLLPRASGERARMCRIPRARRTLVT